MKEGKGPDRPVLQEELENKHDTNLDQPEKTGGSPMRSKSVARRYGHDGNVSEMTMHTMQSETIKASFVSASDVASNSSGRKR